LGKKLYGAYLRIAVAIDIKCAAGAEKILFLRKQSLGFPS
jgi:hypothetical protein